MLLKLRQSAMVYLIDDDSSVRRGFGMFIKSVGLEYQTFRTAEDFLSEITLDSDDLIILDLKLPGMGGCDVLRQFMSRGINIPVIVVTAYGDQQSVACCREYGVKAYLKKPVDGNGLLDLIKYHLVT